MDTVMTPRSPAPHVFISHASADNERFVVAFATALRGQFGINAWLDVWELQPGDSLIQKIFAEGIGHANFVIIILSLHSVASRWVQQEIDAGFMQRMEGKAKIIPVLIENCEVPVALKATKYVRIPDLMHFDQELDEIVRLITGANQRPPLGKLPRHTTLAIDSIPGLTLIDSEVFHQSGACILQEGHLHIQPQQVLSRLSDSDISEAAMIESLLVLADRHLIKLTAHDGPEIYLYTLTEHGFENYGRRWIDDFDCLLNQTMLLCINNHLETNDAIAAALNQPPILMTMLLGILHWRRLLRITDFGHDGILVREVTIAGKRLAASL
jgi:hypothetical protein